MSFAATIEVPFRLLPVDYVTAQVGGGCMTRPDGPNELVEVEVQISFEAGHRDPVRYRWNSPCEDEAHTIESVELDGGWGHEFPLDELDEQLLLGLVDDHLSQPEDWD